MMGKLLVENRSKVPLIKIKHHHIYLGWQILDVLSSWYMVEWTTYTNSDNNVHYLIIIAVISLSGASF